MRISKFVLGLSAALALGAAGLSAAHAQAGSTVDPERLALARRIYALMGGDADQALTTMMKGMMANMSARPGVDPARTEAMKAALMDSFGRLTPRLLDGAAEIMAQDFTTAQLHDVLTYYQSPTGQAMVHKMPEITRQSVQLGVALVPQMMRDFETDYCSRVACTAQEQQMFSQLNARLAQGAPSAPVSR